MNITDAVFEIKKLNERIAYLEKAYAELYRDTTAMMGEDKERIKVLEAENEGLKGEILLSTVPLHEHQELRARLAALVEAAREHFLYHRGELPADRYVHNSYIKIYKDLEAALAEVK